MDLAILIDEIRSLNQKLNVMTEKLDSLDQKISNINSSQQIRDETMRKSANSITIILRLLAGLRKLNSTELRNFLVDSDALLHTIHPISNTEQNVDQIPVTMDRLQSILKEAIDVVNLLPSAQQPSTSNSNDTDSNDTEMEKMKKIEEANRIRIRRKYQNKYNYIDQIKPPVEDSVEEQEFQNNPLENVTVTNVRYSVQNDSNDDTENNPNDITQNNLNGPFTRQDIENNSSVYELLKSRLENSPYNHSAFIINNVNATHFTVKMPNGEDCTQPLRDAQPLVVIKKCDALFSDKLKKNKSNKNNNNKASTKMNKRETKTNTTRDKTNSSISCVETNTEKRSLETKNSEPFKKKKTK